MDEMQPIAECFVLLAGGMGARGLSRWLRLADTRAFRYRIDEKWTHFMDGPNTYPNPEKYGLTDWHSYHPDCFCAFCRDDG